MATMGGTEDAAAGMAELSKLRAQVSALESEREMRVKLEKLLEVQTVQVDLQKELRIKTESLLQVEQQSTSKLRQQIEEMRMQPGPETETRKRIEERLAEAQQHIKKLEQQITESSAPETSDRMESQLRVQVEEQEQLITRLTQQLESSGGRGISVPEGEVVRLQMLLQTRDKHLDELSHSMRKAQNDLGEVQSEVDVVKHQNRVLRKEVSERTEEMERQLNSERNLRADVFQLQGKLEHVTQQHQDEARRASGYAQQAAERDEFERRVRQLEANLSEEQVTASRERDRLKAECDHRVEEKEKIVNHQKTMIQSLNTELKEKQEDIDRLMRTGSPPPMTSPQVDTRERGGWLPPLSQQSPRSEDVQGQRSIESLHRQIKAKDVKIGKQTDRIQTLTEMLEKRDQQLEELSTARRERENAKQRAAELEEVLKAQPRASTHTEAERRLIEQEQRARENERRIRELEDGIRDHKGEKEALHRELGGLRGNLAQGASSAGALQEENTRLSRELQDTRRQLDGRTEELRRVREARPMPPPPEQPRTTSMPALQRRLQKLEELDQNLARDVAVHMQERENKVDGLNSTINLLRNTVDDLRKQMATGSGPDAAAPPEVATSVPISPAAPSSTRGPTRSSGLVEPPANAGSPRSDNVRSYPLGLDAGQAAPVNVRDGFTEDRGIDQAAATLTTEDVRQELIARRREANNLESQLNEKQQLVMKLIEEANLCNAEVASLQQTVQQAYKAARKKDREFDKLQEEKDKYEKAAKQAQRLLHEKESKISKMLKEHQEDTSGNAAIDDMEQKVGWKLKVIAPRQHEIRHSMFLVLNRRQAEGQPPAHLDKVVLAQGLAHHFAISVGRIEIVEDARLPDSAVGEGNLHRSPSPGSIESFPETPRRDFGAEDDEDMQRFDSPGGRQAPVASKRDLVLVNIADAETDEEGQPVRSTISALDVLDQVRNDMLRGRKVGPIGGIEVDAVFINHGDMVLMYEWPSMQAKCLLREGRVLAGKHAVVTVHEVRDPYVLRVVAYDTEVGREFVLFLNTRDVMLLLDTHDSETMQGSQESSDQGPTYLHLEGVSTTHYRQVFSVSEGPLLEIIVNSLSFSVWQNQQILVASEMRIPSSIQQPPAQGTQSLVALALEGQAAQRSLVRTPEPFVKKQSGAGQERAMPVMDDGRPQQPAVLPEVGPTRGLLPAKRETKRLFEDVIGFEGRLCVFSLVHTVTQDLKEDMLRCSVYYPRTCAHVEACLNQPMLSDRLRVVAEAGQLDPDGPLSVVIVVEETIYPPSFLVRLTSVSLEDAYLTSPKEEAKPHTHVLRVAKDGSSVLHLPDISFAVSPSTMRDKLLRCIGLSSPVQGPRETQLTMPSVENILGPMGAKQSGGAIMKRAVTGHVSAPYGLKVQLINSGSRHVPDADGTDPIKMSMPAAVRAQLRAKYGKGRLLVRHGRMLNLHGKKGTEVEAIRAVVSIYERPQPYQHFVMCAYEPQTSREWETLADSIDVFRLFTDNKERQETIPQALDLATPATQEKLAEVLVNCVELAERNDEFVLIVPPETIRNYVERSKQKQLEAAQVAALESGAATPPSETSRLGSAGSQQRSIEPFDVRPAISRVIARSGEGGVRVSQEAEDPVEQRTGDRLFTAQRRLVPAGRGPADPYKIQIYDHPLVTTLHNYVVVATPIHGNMLAAAGLPAAIMAEWAHRPGSMESISKPKPHQKVYTLRVDDRMLNDIITDPKLLEPSYQEELLHNIFKALQLVEAENGIDLKMIVRKIASSGLKAIKDDPEALAEMLETGHNAPGMMPAGNIREVGGSYPLNRLRIGTQKESPAGPSLRGGVDYEGTGRTFSRDWKKVFCMAQRFGTATVMITVSKWLTTYKLAVYEPESSALYEMSLVTSSSSTPLNVLIERCDLAGKLDLVMCMHEVSFPHQLSVNLIHLPTSQEFNLKIGDDFVYTMTENSRREAFIIYLDQLLHWGCIGFDAAPGTEDQVLSNAFEETFAGNQIFDRTPTEDVLQSHLNATMDSGELRAPTALAPQPPKKIRVPVIRTQLDFLGKRVNPISGITMHLVYHAEYNFPMQAGQQQTLLMRIHKRVTNNDIAVTLRVRTADCQLSLPAMPDVGPQASSANGRPFETPALGAGESKSSAASEITLWISDKCSRAPCGAYGELCEVPGIDKSLLLLVTDEDSPRAIRLAVTLATLPFTVLFQVVLLESSEPTAKVDTSSSSSSKNTSRKVLQQIFLKYFGLNRTPTSAVLSHIASNASAQRDQDLRKKLDDLSATDGPAEHLGLEHGLGAGEPRSAADAQRENDVVQVSIVHMCTRQKLGRMMVFTIYRDMISQNMYLRVVMHDPVTGKEQHLTLLHYTTQRLLNILRINRDMIEESYTNMSDDDKRERTQLKAELGKLIVDHLYLKRVGDPDGFGEELDDHEVPDEEELEYELRMRDIMNSANSSDLTVKQTALDSAHHLFPETSRALQQIGSSTPQVPQSMHPAQAATQGGPKGIAVPQPKTLIEMTEDHLLHKTEKVVNGRRVLVAFYNETNRFDNVNYSHNIRIVVACMQSLAVLAVQDFHEDTLELLCARRGKRHLMSSTKEKDLVQELGDILALQHAGQKVTGITFAGMDD
mmetsp:Transcript_39186/g.72532  ORF Transcript_39186/g.72532 Transcript_39186/m.72532 type:complete len:2608 (+) Transcript_39186:108-7931(+)